MQQQTTCCEPPAVFRIRRLHITHSCKTSNRTAHRATSPETIGHAKWQSRLIASRRAEDRRRSGVVSVMAQSFLAALILLCAVLAGCGGGGVAPTSPQTTGSIAGATPMQVPTAAPTPAPTANVVTNTAGRARFG